MKKIYLNNVKLDKCSLLSNDIKKAIKGGVTIPVWCEDPIICDNGTFFCKPYPLFDPCNSLAM